jgi:hypothetical protein
MSIAPLHHHHARLHAKAVDLTEKDLYRSPHEYSEVADYQTLEGCLKQFSKYSRRVPAPAPDTNREADNFPPHLPNVPPGQEPSPFDPAALAETQVMLSKPDDYKEFAPDPSVDTMRQIEDHCRRMRDIHAGRAIKNMYHNPNIGDREDWYSDAVFAQQSFTGVNPTTIFVAPQRWVDEFTQAARLQNNSLVEKLIAERAANKSLLVQDCSYFRSAAGVSEDADMVSIDGKKRLCAPVCLFNLEDSGKLHPLAVIIDWRGSLDKSVAIFNHRLNSLDKQDEQNQWAWRFAKTCVNSADWARHEIVIHLVNTHLVEEAIMLGADGILSNDHIVRQLLKPHWDVTRPVNTLARGILVPAVILQLAGVSATQLFTFLNTAYYTFDFVGQMVPNDLKARGFPTTEEELKKPKYHNYGYARNIVKTWDCLRKFVSTALTTHYEGSDSKVAADTELQRFCARMVSTEGANLKSFPASIKTLEGVIDMVTMCIHIATAQHSAVNYLQEYYQVFVANRPSGIYRPLPKTIEELNQFTERDLVNSLPIKATQDRQTSSDYLISAQLPYLLSFPAPTDLTITTYAENESRSKDKNIASAALQFREDLDKLGVDLREISLTLDDHLRLRYRVLDPELTATSIII